MSDPSSRCGRLTDHEPHTWSTQTSIVNGQSLPRLDLNCPGVTVVEGGHWDRCDYCREVVTSDNSDTTCASHVVCTECAGDHYCSDCTELRQQMAEDWHEQMAFEASRGN